ncbi:MAG: Xaa-Pro peptidase family protein [bacterium]
MMTQTTPAPAKARLAAGSPEINSTLYWRIQHSVYDPVVLIELPTPSGMESVLILRDIEMERARKNARVDRVACPADFTPAGGLSGDRETANAQAAAECLRRAGVTCVVGERSLPLIYADFVRKAGITIECDPAMWVLERRQKSAQEVAHLRESQQVTGQVMEMACRMIATADVRADGVLMRDGKPLTSERVRAAVDHWLLDRGFNNGMTIIAGGPGASDCHYLGFGELRTGEPVIVDIFPKNGKTHYCGDCTRTVVHGEIPEEVKKMHAAVQKAKAAAEKAIAPGVTGETVHLATKQAMLDAGYAVGLPGEKDPLSYCALTHGTGHGVGLDVHEPPLLDMKGPALMVGEAVTVEPGLYRRDLGGVRIEDLVVVTEHGCENLNPLYDGLCWK